MPVEQKPTDYYIEDSAKCLADTNPLDDGLDVKFWANWNWQRRN